MKKLAFSILACFAFVQSSFAATSALTDSLLEYDAITSALGTNPKFENVIPAGEFIVDIKRITKQIDSFGKVQYRITTLFPTQKHSHSHSHEFKTAKYIATLNVSPNPAIGPHIITVKSIVREKDHDHDK